MVKIKVARTTAVLLYHSCFFSDSRLQAWNIRPTIDCLMLASQTLREVNLSSGSKTGTELSMSPLLMPCTEGIE